MNVIVMGCMVTKLIIIDVRPPVPGTTKPRYVMFSIHEFDFYVIEDMWLANVFTHPELQIDSCKSVNIFTSWLCKRYSSTCFLISSRRSDSSVIYFLRVLTTSRSW